jgi:hypothetical protein
MKLCEVVAGPQRLPKYTFHDTFLQGASFILKSGEIQSMGKHSPEVIQDYIDDKVFSQDDAEDYGKWTYTSTFQHGNWKGGITSDDVLFVINISKIPNMQHSVHEPDAEGGLLMVPHEIPMSAVELMFINNTRPNAANPDIVKQIIAMAQKQNIPVGVAGEKTRIDVLNQYGANQ